MPSFSLLVKIYKKTGCTVPASGRKQPVFLCRFPNFFRIFILLLQFTTLPDILLLFITFHILSGTESGSLAEALEGRRFLVKKTLRGF